MSSASAADPAGKIAELISAALAVWDLPDLAVIDSDEILSNKDTRQKAKAFLIRMNALPEPGRFDPDDSEPDESDADYFEDDFDESDDSDADESDDSDADE